MNSQNAKRPQFYLKGSYFVVFAILFAVILSAKISLKCEPATLSYRNDVAEVVSIPCNEVDENVRCVQQVSYVSATGLHDRLVDRVLYQRGEFCFDIYFVK